MTDTPKTPARQTVDEIREIYQALSGMTPPIPCVIPITPEVREAARLFAEATQAGHERHPHDDQRYADYAEGYEAGYRAALNAQGTDQ